MTSSEETHTRWSEYVAKWYEEHKDKPEDLAKKIAFDEGQAMGQAPTQSSTGVASPAPGPISP